MDEEINITNKLKKLVKRRNIPVVVNKQEFSYKKSKPNLNVNSSQSYFYSSEE